MSSRLSNPPIQRFTMGMESLDGVRLVMVKCWKLSAISCCETHMLINLLLSEINMLINLFLSEIDVLIILFRLTNSSNYILQLAHHVPGKGINMLLFFILGKYIIKSSSYRTSSLWAL